MHPDTATWHQVRRPWRTEWLNVLTIHSELYINENAVLLFSYTNCTACVQSKALRERWLLDGTPSAGPEHDGVKRQLEQDEAKTKSLEDTITRWGTQMSGPLPVSIPFSESSCVLLVQAGGGTAPVGGWRHSPTHNTHCSEYTHSYKQALTCRHLSPLSVTRLTGMSGFTVLIKLVRLC